MSKKTAVWLIVAAFLIVIGGIVFTGVMTMLHWDFKALSTTRYETNEYTFTDSFQNVSVNTSVANVVFVPSDTDIASVVCREQRHLNHTVTVTDGTLCVALNDTRKWYEYLSFFNFETSKITVALPAGAYRDLSVHTSTGNVSVPADFTFEQLDITGSTGNVHCNASCTGAMSVSLSTGHITCNNVTAGEALLDVTTGNITVNGFSCQGSMRANVRTGKANLNDVTCGSLLSDGTTGNLMMKNVLAFDILSVKRSTGNVLFERCDADEIVINTSTGTVKGTLVTDKIIFAESHTGHVEVPRSATGGKCEITTSTGDIRIEITP